MYSKIFSGMAVGIDGVLISVEADISAGIPGLDLVGYLSKAVSEAGDRVRTAIHNSGYSMPARRITVNLAPADLRKDGSAFDLAIAAAILLSMQIISDDPEKVKLNDTLFLGELGLDGSVIPVSGVLPIVHYASENGIRRVITAPENVAEASLIKDVKAIGVKCLKELIDYLKLLSENKENEFRSEDISEYSETKIKETKSGYVDFADIHGQATMKRGMMVAAAGFHNILMTGAAGAGKSMMSKALTGIMPELTYREQLELTKIYSVAGLLKQDGSLMTERPFRSPHHTISDAAMLGGGRNPKPGEISLASCGVLFLDEFPEFKRSVIEALRQPMEEREVTVSRARASYTFPAKFMLVAARNNCPCGFYPDRNKCKCTFPDIMKYQNKISRPIMDRIDIRLEVRAVTYNELFENRKEMTTSEIREIVKVARDRQEFRYKGEDWIFNSQLPQRYISDYIRLSDKLIEMLKDAYNSMDLSARGYFKLLRLARTIADINDRDDILEEDIHEALYFRNEGGRTNE